MDAEFWQWQTREKSTAAKITNRRQEQLDGGRVLKSFPPGVDRMGRRLLQVVLGQVNRELGDESRAAPVGGRTTLVSGGKERTTCRVITREGVAIAFVEIRIEVAQVKRELLPGKCDANVPVGVALVRDAARHRRQRNAIEAFARSQAPTADIGGEAPAHSL